MAMNEKYEGVNLDLLGETIAMLSADMYQTLYDMSDGGYTEVASEIRDAALEFEKELKWDNLNDSRDYIEELEKFEQKKLEEWKKQYEDIV